MEKFDIQKMSPKLRQEIQACKNTEELKAVFSANNMNVPDSKLEAILKYSEKLAELHLDELGPIFGGGCVCEDCEVHGTPSCPRVYCSLDGMGT